MMSLQCESAGCQSSVEGARAAASPSASAGTTMRQVASGDAVEAARGGVTGTERRNGGAPANSGSSDVVRVAAPVSPRPQKVVNKVCVEQGNKLTEFGAS